MKNTCFVYASKYGTTQQIISEMAMVAGPAVACTPDQFEDNYKSSDLFVLATPVYKERVDEGMMQFIEKNADWLRTKKIALLCVNMVGSEGKKYLEAWMDILGEAVIWAKCTGGRLQLAGLSKEDYDDLWLFDEKMDYPFMNADFSDQEQIMKYAVEIRKLRNYVGKNMPVAELKGYIEQYLVSHNTCALATAAAARVRVTPLEYSYAEGCLYILSEGGEKFAQIMLNPDVSLCVYDDYSSMSKIGGIQLQGSAVIIKPDAPEYENVLVMKKMDGDSIRALPFSLYVLKIELIDADFLWHCFADMGWGVQQHYEFEAK